MADVTPSSLSEPISTGTTLVAVACADGVIVGTDSRTSSGQYIVSRATDKITPISDNIVVLRSGSSADTQFIAKEVLRDIEIESLLDQVPVGVEKAAQLFRQYAYYNRVEISAGMIVAGWDTEKGGQIYAIPRGGFISREHFITFGSGSGVIMGYLDEKWKPAMSKEDAITLVSSCVRLAIYRDGSSGGVIRIGYISKDGVERSVLRPDKDQFPEIRTEEGYSRLPEHAASL